MKSVTESKSGLEMRHITIKVDEKTIIKEFSLDILPGEIHVLMGPNGSGKSTIAGTLSGNPKYTVTTGSIFFNGDNITYAKPEERAKRGIFLAFQYPLEIPGLQVGQYLFQIAKKRNPTISFTAFQEKVHSYLTLLNLDVSFLQRELNCGFSGGEKKRMEVVQLLLTEPSFAILDETDSGVDVDALKALGATLRELRRKTSMLIITHYPHLLKYLQPDKVHLFKEGMIITTGDTTLAKEIEEKGYTLSDNARPANN